MSGLGAGASAALNNDINNDALTLTANGPFVFGKKVADGELYNVSVKTPPSGKACVVQKQFGSAHANVSNVAAYCGVPHALSGHVSGLETGDAVTLSQDGLFNLEVKTNGSFAFQESVPEGMPYLVSASAPS